MRIYGESYSEISEMALKQSRGRLDVSSSVFLICDMQVGLRPYTWCFTEIATIAQTMVGTKILE